MVFFGRLGIDIKLLIAQMINFGLLLWLLSRFLYKPIVKKIEKDEKELEQAKLQEEKLNKEKEAFEAMKKQETIKAKKSAKEIIKEAEKIAQEIKDRVKEEAEKEMERLKKQQAKYLQSQKKLKEKEALKKLKKEIILPDLIKAFKGIITKDSLRTWQDIFFSRLLKEIKALPRERFGRYQGSIILEEVSPLRSEQRKELGAVLSKRFNQDIKIQEKRNKNLLAGFRIEIPGIVIEENLFFIIKNAVNIKKTD